MTTPTGADPQPTAASDDDRVCVQRDDLRFALDHIHIQHVTPESIRPIDRLWAAYWDQQPRRRCGGATEGNDDV
jgi:hypothetical protein